MQRAQGEQEEALRISAFCFQLSSFSRERGRRGLKMNRRRLSGFLLSAFCFLKLCFTSGRSIASLSACHVQLRHQHLGLAGHAARSDALFCARAYHVDQGGVGAEIHSKIHNPGQENQATVVTHRPPPKTGLVVWWVLWASFLVGIFAIFHFVSRSTSSSPAAGPRSAAWLVALLPIAASGIVRWVILPRVTTAQTAWPLFILGIAFAESTTFFGLFLFPAHRQGLFIISALGIAQFVPIFASRFYSGPGQKPPQ